MEILIDSATVNIYVYPTFNNSNLILRRSFPCFLLPLYDAASKA